MAKLPPYAVLLRDIPEQDTPLHRSFAVPPERVGEWLAGPADARRARGPEPTIPTPAMAPPSSISTPRATHVFAAGTFKGELTVACSRCVEPVKLAIDEQVRVTFLPQERDAVGR